MSALRLLHTFQAMDFVLAATGQDIGMPIQKLVINAQMELITMKNSECALHALRTCPSGMDLLASDARQLNSLIKGLKDASPALAD